MEKIIVAIRTLNDNLKIVATRVDELEKRIDTIAARIDGVGSSLTDSIHNLSAQTEARLAELTARVYALENAGPEETAVADDVGDALDDIVGMETPTDALDDIVGMEETTSTVAASTVAAPTTVDDVVKYVMDNKDAELTIDAPAKTAPKKTPAKTKAVVASAVQRRAYARQYMVEHGAKVEDLRSPAKIEEVMQTEEFETWVASR